MDITLNGNPITTVTDWRISEGFGSRTAEVTINDASVNLGDEMVFSDGTGEWIKGIVQSVNTDTSPSGVRTRAMISSGHAIGSGTFDPTITATTGAGYKITGKLRAWRTFPTAEAEFRYGDVVRHKDFPEQREMVVKVDEHSVHTIVLDSTDSHRGEMTSYIPSVLVKIE